MRKIVLYCKTHASRVDICYHYGAGSGDLGHGGDKQSDSSSSKNKHRRAYRKLCAFRSLYAYSERFEERAYIQ
ncbi:unnamed protein product [Periconia digitata]|uniref:Uncharacterized protein n=1 Tax=Periconia digitata TaxID=1303443 RepID=A0A9W4U1H5_9PLEO|nr:unnamed protein product [Periconia digitata]